MTRSPSPLLLHVFLAGVVTASMTCMAQDRRTVVEPHIPTTCARLSANFAAQNGTLAGADEAKLDTERLQAALDHCHPGQAVELTSDGARNAFLSGPLSLPARITLLLDRDVTLFASRDPALYDLAPGSCGVVNNQPPGCKPLISVHNAPHAAVMGDGTIDGRGYAQLLNRPVTWWQLAEQARAGGRQQVPRLIVVSGSDDFTLYRITLKNSPNFHVTFGNGTGFTAWGVKIDTPRNARNTDGIDPGGSASDITVTHSFISTGDDHIAIKGSGHGVQHMSVLDNHFYFGHGMSIGSETFGGVSDVLVRNLTLDGADNGLRIKSNIHRGGLVQRITYEDVCIRNTKAPISIDTRYDNPGPQADLVPDFRDISISDVFISGGGKIIVDGQDAAHRSQVHFSNVTLDNPTAYNFFAKDALVTYGPGAVNFHLAGEDVTSSNTKGEARQRNPTSALSVSFPSLANNALQPLAKRWQRCLRWLHPPSPSHSRQCLTPRNRRHFHARRRSSSTHLQEIATTMSTVASGTFGRFLPFLVSASLVAISGVAYAAGTCDVRAYGAKGDGQTKDTAAIQKAIDACAAKSGGGTVSLSGGTFVSGPVVLRSNITLDIAQGSTLLGSPDHADYPEVPELRSPGHQSLLTSNNAENITITGGGTIDGNGQSWWAEARGQKDHGVVGEQVFRPRLIVLSNSKHIRIENVTVQNSPSWQIVPYYSDDVTIRNVKILADPHSPNTDAIDPFSSSNMIIDHVYADVGDDNIAIKSGLINSPGPDAPSKNITITDCTFMHGHGLSIGSEIAGGAQHIIARNIHFNGTDQGIRIKANRDRGNDVSDIHFSNIDMQNVGTAILISEYYPKVLPTPGESAQPVGRLTPFFHDITIDNVTATGGKVAGVIVGLPESPVKDVTLHNVTIDAKTGMTVSYAQVTMRNVTVKAAQGESITIAPTAKVDRQ